MNFVVLVVSVHGSTLLVLVCAPICVIEVPLAANLVFRLGFFQPYFTGIATYCDFHPVNVAALIYMVSFFVFCLF